MPTLSLRETRILQGLCEGLSNKAIALLLGISEQSVKNCLVLIYARLGVQDRLQAALRAIELGLVER